MNFDMWGLSGSLATERPDQMANAIECLWTRLESFDVACNRFRHDSELSRLNAAPGVVTALSETLELALDAALRAAEATSGLCDPTVLPSLVALGYDRDYDEVVARVNEPATTAVRPLGPAAVHLDRERHTVLIDAPCQLDLGASAKALVVDLVADDVATSGGVIVELGGDVAVRGNGPEGPWAVGVSDALTITGREPRISLGYGGIATSSTQSRTWRAGSQVVNHIIDPRTGSFAHGPYATASVTAIDCVLANAFATAALLWDEEAAYHIAQAGWSARLVRRNGTVEFVGGWPEDTEAMA
jgi:FAD:protein FMN transferase